MGFDHDPYKGERLGRYTVQRVLGRGGMGVVLLATDETLGRPVALKVVADHLAADADFRQRFVRESRIAASIDHPNVIPVYDAGEIEVDGTDVGTLLRAHGRLPVERTARIVVQVAAGLDAAHARGLLHRDVKPANVLVVGAGDDELAYLTDFGIARYLHSQTGLTPTGALVGTPDYLAPEVLTGSRPVDGRADVYALGCMLVELLTGTVPFPRDAEPAKLFAHVSDPPPVPSERVPGLPPEFDGIVARALAKDPEARFPTAGVLGRETARAARTPQLVSAGRSTPTRVAPPRPTQVPPPRPAERAEAAAAATPETVPARRRPRAAVLAAAGAVGTAVAVVLVLLLTGGSQASRSGSTVASRPSATGGQQQSQSTTSNPGGPAVTAAKARSLVNRYVDSNNTNNATEFASIIAPDVVQKANGVAIVSGKANAIQGFQNGPKSESYKLTFQNVQTGAGSATVNGSYDVRSPSLGEATGSISFTERTYGGQLLISEIDVNESTGGALSQLLGSG